MSTRWRRRARKSSEVVAAASALGSRPLGRVDPSVAFTYESDYTRTFFSLREPDFMIERTI